MLRYSITLLYALKSLKSVSSDLTQYDYCPCLITHTCPSLSKCFIDNQREKLAGALSRALTPKRNSPCYHDCGSPRASFARSQSDTGAVSSDSAPLIDVPVNLTRLQRRHINGYVKQKLNKPTNCLGSHCATTGDTGRAGSIAIQPASVTRIAPSTGSSVDTRKTTVYSPTDTPGTTAATPDLITSQNTSTEK